ncbi:glycoside hydrolase family 2 [Myceligenerans cantabricum]
MRRRRPPALLAALSLTALALAGATTPATAVAPAAPGAQEPAAVHGLQGEYFAMSAPGERDFATLGGTTLDPNVDFDDLVGTFTSLTGQGEHTTARWTGTLTAPETASYTFHAIGDNGFRMFLDGEPVIDHWVEDWDNEQHSDVVELVAGEPHEFRFELFQDYGGANMHLRWSADGIAKQAVPLEAFTPPEDFEVYPLDLDVTADGGTLVADLAGDVTSPAAPESLTVEVDTTDYPVASATVDPDDPTRLLVALEDTILAGQRIKVEYDGAGGLAEDGEPVPQILRHAGNSSTQRLTTTWGEDLDREHPLPEYPRPQQEREDWKNLNGPWQFEGVADGAEPVFGEDLDEEIVVPFAVESQLSGIERHEDHMQYRRTFTVPAGWDVGDGSRLRLHLGAVDHEARVYVNGRLVAEHTGGYTAFSADVTDALTGTGPQELVVAVTDTTGAEQPVGKQSRDPGGIFYTQVSGIWQTVWMEPVPEVAVDDVVLTPHVVVPDGGGAATATLDVEVVSADASDGATAAAVVRDADGTQVGRADGPANETLTVDVAEPRLWSPDDPYLYDVDVELTDGDVTDEVASYAGLRTIAVEQVGGHPKLVLNGAPIFSLATLDQGFFPDGLYTAPSDEALAFDLEAHKELGYNSVRKHIKAESDRWFYHADRLGLLVWQDFVSGTYDTEAGRDAFVREGERIMAQHASSPATIGWIVFNEGWGEWDRDATGALAEQVKAADPDRIVSAHSGVNCCASQGDSGAGDVIDHHDYTNQDPPFPDATRIAFDGEHGGFTLRTPGHMWPGTPAAIYSGVADKAALTAKYVENTEEFYLAEAGTHLSGSVYTQITDLENELNGLYTYDRKELKVDPGPVREINERVVEAGADAG